MLKPGSTVRILQLNSPCLPLSKVKHGPGRLARHSCQHVADERATGKWTITG